MSTIEQPTKESRDHEAAVTGWITAVLMFVTATCEAGLLGSLLAPWAKTWQDQVQMYLAGGIFGLLWLWCAWVEWDNRYDSEGAFLGRRGGLLLQVIILSLITWTGWPRTGPWDGAVISMLAIPVTWLWRAWMKTQSLHPDDQSEIDHLLIERNKQRGVALEAKRQKARLERRLAALAHLNLDAPATAPMAAKPAEPRFNWPVPEGKHKAHVYFIGNGSRVKIGTTSSLRARVSALSLRTSDIVLLIAGDRRMEQAMHKRFADQRVGSTEWFENTGPLADFIRGHNEQALTAAKQGS